MNRLKIFTLIFMSFFFVILAFAQSNINQKIPAGMEVIPIGASGQLIVPKGTKTRRVGAQIIVEGTKEYMSRRFQEMEERFTRVEKNQEDLRSELEALKGMVNGIQKPINP